MREAEDATRTGPDLPGLLQDLWRRGRRPDLASFLAEHGQVEAEMLFALIRLDQRQRWLAGERPDADHYLSLFPSLAGSPIFSVELRLAEMQLREELDPTSA